MILEEAEFSVAEAVEIVGLSKDRFDSWVRHSDLFADRRKGRGKHFIIRFRDLLALSAIKLLIDCKLCEPKNAIPLIDYGSLYELMIDKLTPLPGLLVLTKTDDGIKGYFDPDSRPELQVRIDLWALCDGILPGTLEAIRKAYIGRGVDRVEQEIQRAIDSLNQFRPTR